VSMLSTSAPFAIGCTSCAREILSAGRNTMDGMPAAAAAAAAAACSWHVLHQLRHLRAECCAACQVNHTASTPDNCLLQRQRFCILHSQLSELLIRYATNAAPCNVWAPTCCCAVRAECCTGVM
jgi:hypothetical protein